mmetsp:Transcript_26332/g.82562  ORF Transcript_26332/g.82562 Transcript_26332/m.82562 type:complete len:329 (+) Transcript_26332:2-988(+)
MASAAPAEQPQQPAAEAQAEAPANGQPQKPKKALSAYWIFTNRMREEVTREVKAKNGGKSSIGDVAKAMTARWSALSEEARREFEERAAEDKLRYAAELKAYQEACDPAGMLRSKYAHLIPKKPMTPYFAFSQEPAKREKAAAALKEAGSEAGLKQITAKLAEAWKAMSAEEKAPYEEKHKQDQAEFLKRQSEWQATPEFKEIEEAAKRQAEQQGEGGQEASTPVKGAKRGRPPAKSPGEKEAKKAAEPSAAGAGKRARKAAPAKEEGAAIDEDVLADAAKAGLEGMLRNLASRPEVAAAGKTSREIFTALQAANGLVNPARRVLLGA